jgi:dCTP deaminase
LQPKKLYLGSTVEEIGSDHFVTQLIGRSSVGRLGLFLQITASLGHVGSKHCWTLELKVVQPLRIYPNMKIGQVSFWKMDGVDMIDYNGKYQKYSLPHISEFYKEIV